MKLPRTFHGIRLMQMIFWCCAPSQPFWSFIKRHEPLCEKTKTTKSLKANFELKSEIEEAGAQRKKLNQIITFVSDWISERRRRRKAKRRVEWLNGWNTKMVILSQQKKSWELMKRVYGESTKCEEYEKQWIWGSARTSRRKAKSTINRSESPGLVCADQRPRMLMVCNFQFRFIYLHDAAAVVVGERSLYRLLLMIDEKHLITTLGREIRARTSHATLRNLHGSFGDVHTITTINGPSIKFFVSDLCANRSIKTWQRWFSPFGEKSEARNELFMKGETIVNRTKGQN